MKKDCAAIIGSVAFESAAADMDYALPIGAGRFTALDGAAFSSGAARGVLNKRAASNVQKIPKTGYCPAGAGKIALERAIAGCELASIPDVNCAAVAARSAIAVKGATTDIDGAKFGNYDRAAPAGRDVADEVAAADENVAAAIEDRAACSVSHVASKRAAFNGEPAGIVVDRPSVYRPVAGETAVADMERAEVDDSAAVIRCVAANMLLQIVNDPCRLTIAPRSLK